MRFKFSEQFVIDTAEEPWRSDGIRIGKFANPGAGKSYNVALLAEQWMDQGGTVVIFEPLAEYHTLKQKYQIQQVGGPILQDVPLVLSEPRLYADIVVEQGVSLIFYTGEVEKEEDLVGFVQRFIDRVKTLQQTRHRPILIVIEEAEEYVPQNTAGHSTPPWVFNVMVSSLKKLFSQGRKLNIVPVVVSQRPQDVKFSIRQLCNIVWFGGFSPQDAKYLDKEVFALYRKRGIEISASDLVAPERGTWSVIVGKTPVTVQVTEKRKTPHGADTPSLDHIEPVSAEVKQAVSGLGEQLRALLEKRAAEESELERAKRRLRELEKEAEDLRAKVKLRLDLKSMLEGGPVDEAEIEKRVNEVGAKYRDELVKLGKDVEVLRGEVKTLRDDKIFLEDENHRLAKDNEAWEILREGLRRLVGSEPIDVDSVVERKVKELLPSIMPTQGGKAVQPYEMEKTIADLTLVKRRLPLKLDSSTLQGKILYLITDGFFNRKGVASISKVMGALKLQFGKNVNRADLQSDIQWYVDQEVLQSVATDPTHVYYVLRDDAKDRVRAAIEGG